MKIAVQRSGSVAGATSSAFASVCDAVCLVAAQSARLGGGARGRCWHPLAETAAHRLRRSPGGNPGRSPGVLGEVLGGWCPKVLTANRPRFCSFLINVLIVSGRFFVKKTKSRFVGVLRGVLGGVLGLRACKLGAPVATMLADVLRFSAQEKGLYLYCCAEG